MFDKVNSAMHFIITKAIQTKFSFRRLNSSARIPFYRNKVEGGAAIRKKLLKNRLNICIAFTNV